MKKFKITALSLVFWLIIFSCQDNSFEVPDNDIGKARSWLENSGTLSNQRTFWNQSSGSQLSFKKTPDWDQSMVHAMRNGKKAVEVRLNYDNFLVVSEGDETLKTKPSVINSMIMFETSSGNYEVYLLKLYPENPTEEDLDNLNFNNLSGFSGRMMLFDWNENFIGGWKVEDGKKTYSYGKADNSIRQGARVASTNGVSCYAIDTYWYSIACVNGVCGDPILIEVITTIVCVIEIAPGDPGEGGGGGGGSGGGGGEDPGCMEPHPFIEGLMVPCGQEEWDMDQQNQNKICGGYSFTSTGDGMTAEVLNLGATAHNSRTNQVLNAYWGAMCITFGSSGIVDTPQAGSEAINQAWNATMNEAPTWLKAQVAPTSGQFSLFIIRTFRSNLAAFSGGYAAVSAGECAGNIASTTAVYCN